MQNILQRLEQRGLQQKYVRAHALPAWWDAELENDSTVVAEAAGYIARRLGLDIASVFSPESAITFKGHSQTKFKKRQNTDSQSLEVAQGLALRVAEIVQYATPLTYRLTATTTLSAIQIREQLLTDNSTVRLDNLLAFCTSIGIPVVHYSDLPKGVKKVDGLVAYFDDQPVVVLCRAKQYDAWLAFILAHELGHILCGHATGQVFVDEDIAAEQDNEEVEANLFASTLLLGQFSGYKWQRMQHCGALVNQARRLSRQYKVDPGTICLNYAWQTQDWVTGMAALKKFEKNANAPQFINTYLGKYLSPEKLDRDSQEYLRLVTGV
ncbi:MAG: ImmA/IrrE family metallo-endopeptidase [Cyanobacteria bacterium P01_D01_bin.156]